MRARPPQEESMRKLNTGLMVLVVSLVLVPTVAMAATGSFSSSSSTTALKASNTGTGTAIAGTSKTGYAGSFVRTTTTGATPTLYGKNPSTTPGASGVFGYETATSGSVYGVYGRSASSSGRGVYGLATSTSNSFASYGVFGRSSSPNTDSAGVLGYSTATTGNTQGVLGISDSATGAGVVGSSLYGVVGLGSVGLLGFGGSVNPGDGTYGVIASGSDTGIGGHLLADGGNVAGTCTISTGSSNTCAFPNDFASGTATPIVILTPTSSITGNWWVSGTTLHQFDVNVSAPQVVTFNYIAIGIDSTLS